ncbi:YtxH domain-containing protein [Alkalibacillus almallahensis]|uniref:YtxH domain-containing protein n=1 Tax=Alkalibacillus almallahensis TaxID=1379154 RepID=UPI00141E58FE|nr:YtxH domain-containing protein [Alkalibacillus almallahensis]NIK13475.1 gas vesicle protein [Alkalibacillus almallahensis]
MTEEKQKNEENINSKDFMIGTLLGGIVGASVALLFAPKSGKEIREDLNTGAQQVRERADEWKDVAYEKGNEVSQRMRETKGQLQDKVAEMKNQAQGQNDEVAQDIADAIEEATEELERQEANELYESSQQY